MKIDPEHNGKKPAYYIGLVALAAALVAGGIGIKNEIEEIKKQVEEIMVHTAGIVSAEPAMEAAEAMEAVETTEENA